MADSMNERYSLTAQLSELTGEFRLDRIEFPYYDKEHFEPISQIPVIRSVGQQRCLGGQRWGLMPYWGKSSIHANRDTLGDKPYLMSMLAKKRCVLPCSGLLFDRMEGKRKRTYRRRHPDKQLFGVAGIFDLWLDSEKNEFPMCTMVVGNTHGCGGDGSRPIVLEGEAMDIWLDPVMTAADSLRELLHSIPEPEFRTEAVDDGVWSIK